MKWVMRHGVHYSHPYQIFSLTRGFEIWIAQGRQYACLAREIPTLQEAKGFVVKHENTPDSLAEAAGALEPGLHQSGFPARSGAIMADK